MVLGPRIARDTPGWTPNRQNASRVLPPYIQPLYGARTKTAWYGTFYAVVRPFYPLLKALFPNYVTTTECVGRAMLNATKRGFPKPVLENRDINSMCPKVP